MSGCGGSPRGSLTSLSDSDSREFDSNSDSDSSQDASDSDNERRCTTPRPFALLTRACPRRAVQHWSNKESRARLKTKLRRPEAQALPDGLEAAPLARVTDVVGGLRGQV